jgi:hypothetical protein
MILAMKVEIEMNTNLTDISQILQKVSQIVDSKKTRIYYKGIRNQIR